MSTLDQILLRKKKAREAVLNKVCESYEREIKILNETLAREHAMNEELRAIVRHQAQSLVSRNEVLAKARAVGEGMRQLCKREEIRFDREQMQGFINEQL